MVGCCVPGCSSRQDNPNSKGVTYHEFPANSELRAQWIRNLQQALNKPDLILKFRARICSKHFTKEDYKGGLKIRVLKPGTAPTVFNQDSEPAKPGRPRKRMGSAKPKITLPLNDDNLTSEKPDSEESCGPISEIIAEPSEHSYSNIANFLELSFDDEPLQDSYIPSAEQCTEDIPALQKRITNYQKRIYDMNKKITVLNQKLQLASDLTNNSMTRQVQRVKVDADKGDMMAKFLLNQLQMYSTKVPAWDEDILRHCLIWHLKSPHGYEYTRKSGILKLPSLQTMHSYVIPENVTEASRNCSM